MTAEETLDWLYSLLGDAVLLPIPRGKKGPQFPGWQKLTFAESKGSPELLEAACRGGNIGILLGPASGRLLALDIDRDEPVAEWLAKHPRLADTLRTRGARGCQFWLRLEEGCEYPNGKAVYPLKEAGEVLGELRIGGAAGAQSVILGVHPVGIQYQIVVEKPPRVISLADLDELASGVLFGEESQQSVPTRATNNAAPVPTKGIPSADLNERIRRYMAKVPSSIDGQHGDDQLFRAACILVNDWGLSPDEAFPFLVEYNQRAEPPWPEHRLHYKLKEAETAPCDKPRGHLRDSHTQPDSDTPLTKRLKQEQAQAEAAANGDEADHGEHPEAESIDLEAETQKRFKQYITDSEPFPPPMRLEAFHGVIGQIVQIMVQHCEASPEVLLLHGLAVIGNILGRSAYVNGGGQYLFPNEFAVFVGETARGRKGTAYSMWEHLAQLVNGNWFDGCLTDQALNIEIEHLKAALAVIDFCRDSARWIFGQATGNKLANNIIIALRRSPVGLTRTEINNDVCYRTTPKSQLDAALAELAKNKLAKMGLEEAKKGPRIERWFAAT